MLLADIEFKLNNENFKYKGYISESFSGALVRLVAQDGDSANLLLDEQYSSLQTVVRTAQFNPSTLLVGRLFKPKTLLDENGEDVSKPAYFKKSRSFLLFAYFYSVYTYAKGLKTQTKTVRDEADRVSMLEDTGSTLQSVKDLFETPIGNGYVVRKLNAIQELEFTPSDTSQKVQIRVSIHNDDSFDFLPSYERKQLMGSEVLKMESTGTAYRIPFDDVLRRKVLKLPAIKSISLDLEGIDKATYNPFFTTRQEVVDFENKRAIAERRPARDFSWVFDKIESGEYKLVKPDDVEKVFKQLEKDYKKTGLVAFDTETTGLKFTFKCFVGEGDIMVGAVLSAKVGTSYYFPVSHTKFENVCNGDIDSFVENYLNPFFKGKKVVLHNNYFDYKVSHSHGIHYDCYFDTMVFMRKTFTARDGLEYGLKAVTETFLKRTPVELDDLCRNGSWKQTSRSLGVSFADLESSLVEIYACADADNTLSLALYFIQNGIVDEFGAMTSTVNDSRFSSVVAYSEFYGEHLNLEAVPALRADYEKQRAEAYKALYEFIAVHAPSVALSSTKLAVLYNADDDGRGEKVVYSRRVFKTPLEDFAGVTVSPKGYTVNSSATNVKLAYDILGYPVQTSKKSGNAALDKNAIKALTRATKPNTEAFELSRAETVKALASASDRVSGLKELVARIDSEESVVFSDFDNELIRVASKYLYSQKYGWYTSVSISSNGIMTVEPEKNAPIYPFVALLKNAREIDRVFSTFLDKVSEYFTSDGFCFPSIDAFKVTGRLSYSKPNSQSFDDVVKKEITARDGFYMVDTDYASKENRVIAIMSQEQPLIDMFKDWRNDYHRFQASRLRGILQEQVTDALRGESKGLVFGINFGMSDASLGEVLFGSRSAENTRKAQEKRALFFSFQPHVEAWFENNVKTALNNGYSETIFGSRRYYNRKTTSRAQIRRYALNHPIQGSAADIYKRGMVSLFNDIVENGYLGKILITGFIHDEATIEVHKSIHPHVILGMIRKNMMVDIENGCPLDLGFGVGDSWYSAKKTEWQVGLQEKLEFDTNAYDWKGDIDDYVKWAESRIHEFNAEDVIQMLDKINFPEDIEDRERVFPVNYGLEMNKYLLVELLKGNNWLKAQEQIDFPDGYQNFSPKQKSGFLYKTLGNLHIRKRLIIFKVLSGYNREGIEDMFVDLSELVIEDTVSQTGQTDLLSQREEQERALRLVTDQVVDFGFKLDSSGEYIMLLYSKELYKFVKQFLVKKSESSQGIDVIFYSMKEDALKALSGWVLPEEAITQVRSYASDLAFV